METADFIVIGGGIAGASVGYELSLHGKVVVLEMEASAGYHSTGRSAAVMSENYGPALWSRLVTASRAFLETPPDGFADVPLVTPRGALFLARDGEQARLLDQAEEMLRRGAAIEMTTAREALRFCPVVRDSEFVSALYEPDCKDIDTNALLTGYLRALRKNGGTFIPDARVQSLQHSQGTWQASSPRGNFEAPVVVNAAGGWVQEIAELAGLSFRNVGPFRRTAVVFDPPAGSAIQGWPMTFDVAETFYFKPEAGLGSWCRPSIWLLLLPAKHRPTNWKSPLRSIESTAARRWRSGRSATNGAGCAHSHRIMNPSSDETRSSPVSFGWPGKAAMA